MPTWVGLTLWLKHKTQFGNQGICNWLQNSVQDLRRSGIFIVNFEHISHLVLVFLLLTLTR